MMLRMAAPQRLFVLDDARFDAHAARVPHPEQPARLAAIRRGLVAPLLKGGATPLTPRLAREDELTRAHAPEYVSALGRALDRGHGQLDEDTFYSEGTHTAAWLAAGGAAQLAEQLMASESAAAVLAARPPGHHATGAQAMGFCLLNNVAVAAHAALAAGAERVAILDWDVHHGNGTQAIFESEPRVLFASLHQWPLYPGSGRSDEVGRDEARGTTLNLPLPPGSSSRDYAVAFARVVLPVFEQFRPDLLLVSCGFDAHRQDPLGGMQLGHDDYGAMTELVWKLSEQLGRARLGIVLEGGYDLDALEQAGHSVAQALLGTHFELEHGAVQASTERAVDGTRRALDPFWSL
jgi:acetoin utilization deacetylase AcuC-like enzyme